MNDNDKVVMVPFFVAESMADRLTKANKRLWIICILLIILLVGTNAMWIWYESQFMYYEEYIKQDVETGEGNATRFADANNTRDIIDSQTRGTQAILDKLCTLELDGYKRENDNLRSQLNMATLRESQTAQNAFIAQGFSNEVDQLYNRLSNCPVPSTPVYGRTPIFTCNNNGCGCGCGM